jgi:hypothetical protein
MNWEEISKRIDREVTEGIEVPHTQGGYRPVTQKVGSKIYMRTGVETDAERYTNKEMIKYAFEKIQSGGRFISDDLKSKFPEYSQGTCVFSMTGGILQLLGIAKLKKIPKTNKHCYESIFQ